MPEPLTLDQLTTAIAASETRIGKRIDDAIGSSEKRLEKKITDATEPHFTSLKKDLEGITERLDRIEHILWDGARLAEMERRLIAIAEQVGRPDLATPLQRPIGT